MLPGLLTETFGVVDVDRHKERDGFVTLKKARIKLRALLVAKTAGSGEHHFFAPGSISANGVMEGVDIKARHANGTASYIVAPGTVAPWGRYERVKGDLDLLADAIEHETLPPVPDALHRAVPMHDRGEVKAAVDQSGIPEAVAIARQMAERAKRVLKDAANNGEPRTPALFDQAVHLGTFVACSTCTIKEATSALMQAAVAAG